MNNIKSIITKFNNTLKRNSSIINTAISNDYKFNRYKFSFQELQNIENSLKISTLPLTSKDILIRYNGNPYITLNLILLSIKMDFKVSFYPTKKFSLNEIFIKIFVDILKDMKSTNLPKLVSNISDTELIDIQIDIQNNFDELIYIGNVYDYSRLKQNINIPTIYNGFGTLEVYVDNEDDFSQELHKLNQYVYENNLDLHYFHSTDLKESIMFENTYKDRYCFIIYSKDTEKANKIASLINAKFIYINPEHLNYKFEI